MLFLQGRSLKRNDQCTIGQDYIYYHLLIYKDNCSMNHYTFGSFFPALSAMIRVNAGQLACFYRILKTKQN
jgi:hypothetical protein